MLRGLVSDPFCAAFPQCLCEPFEQCARASSTSVANATWCANCGYLGGTALESLVRHLCGSSPGCEDPKGAYDLALTNLRRKYLFVGLLEHYELSVAVLARLLPEYFGGGDGRGTSGELTRRMQAASRAGTKTNEGGFKYAPLSDTAAQALLTSKQNRYEVSLYHEAALLFWDTVERLGLAEWVS